MEEPQEQQPQKTQSMGVPAAIVLAGLIVAGAILYTQGTPPAQNQPPAVSDQQQITPPATDLENVAPVSAEDHFRGNRNAPVVVIEFSDFECPFCKNFHFTMQQVVADYGGQVAWVYRHFPLTSIHPKAPIEAQATECAAELGGNDVFWAYVDKLFEVTPSNNGLDLEQLPAIAQQVGLDRLAFEQCLSSGRHESKVLAQLEDAVKSGGRGTPYSIIISSSGQKTTIDGAQPYVLVKQLLDAALKQK